MADAATTAPESYVAKLDATELETLAYVAALARNNMLREASAANIASYQRARKALADLEQAAAKPEGESWSNLNQAHAYIVERGYAVSKKQLYEHSKQGRIHKRDDGLYHQADVDKYAAAYLPIHGRPDGADLVEDLQQQIQRATVRLREAQATSAEFKNRIERGDLVEIGSVEAGLAFRAHRFRQDAHIWCKTNAVDLIRQCQGDDAYTPDVIAALTDAFDAWLDRYADPDTWEAVAK